MFIDDCIEFCYMYLPKSKDEVIMTKLLAIFCKLTQIDCNALEIRYRIHKDRYENYQQVSTVTLLYSSDN